MSITNIKKSLGPALTLMSVLLTLPTGAAGYTLDWSILNWSTGTFSNTFTNVGGSGINVTIDISTTASGSWTATGTSAPVGPYEDGTIAQGGAGDISTGAATPYFGTQNDLGIIFDPISGQGQSPVTIDVSFSSPVAGLVFEISDIDWSGAGSGNDARRDQVVLTSDAGDASLSFKTGGTHSFSIAGNTATNGTNQASSVNEDIGTVVVDYGSLAVNTATITYNEVSGSSNPAGRGIGVLANFEFSAVPIPPAVWLFGSGLLGLVGIARRKKTA